MKEGNRTTKTFRLTDATIAALEKRARELGTSQANAMGVMLGTEPASAYARDDKKGKLVTR